jgi:hypothetical protein
MTTLLEQVFAEVSKLPPQEQDAFAAWLLEELQSEARWARVLAASPDTLNRLAKEARLEYGTGRTEKLDPNKL